MRNLRLVQSNGSVEEPSAAARPAEQDPAIAPLPPEVRRLLEHVRIIAPVPRGVRARALARARAAIAGIRSSSGS